MKQWSLLKKTEIKCLKVYFVAFLFFGFKPDISLAQCLIQTLLADSYFQNYCGNQSHQAILGADIPVYGSCGNLHFSPPVTDNTGIINKVNELHFSLQIYPNPAFDYFFIKWPHDDEIKLIIYNQLGQIVLTKLIERDSINKVEIHFLQPGYYVLKAQNKSNQIFYSKLIKQ